LTTPDYDTKADAYFGNVRRDIEPLLPPHAAQVLEVGCGAGATLHWLKQTGRAGHTVGVELFESAAAVARGRVDELLVGNAETLLPGRFEAGRFDLVLCLDVLEHMIDPWAFMTQVQALLRPGGLVVASIPNVRHLRVVLDLLLRGRWAYADDGILDRTHLRFFTRESALALMAPPGLQVSACLRRDPPRASPSGLVNLLSFGGTRDLFTRGYLIAARKG
jgi:2-polyprenyl-3-methyl-5-hydroxy-6-metoxy-1,4-benzoquinol methylase